MKRKWPWALAAALAVLAVYAGTVLATPQVGVTTSTVATGAVDPVNIKVKGDKGTHWRIHLKTKDESDAYVVDNKFSPGGTTGWHTHPGPSLIFVVSGSITNYEGDDPSCTKHVYSAGQTFVDEGGGDVHMLRNETQATAETVAVQIIPHGAQRKTDIPTAPQPC